MAGKHWEYATFERNNEHNVGDAIRRCLNEKKLKPQEVLVVASGIRESLSATWYWSTLLLYVDDQG